jgi:hypothetical protein
VIIGRSLPSYGTDRVISLSSIEAIRTTPKPLVLWLTLLPLEPETTLNCNIREMVRRMTTSSAGHRAVRPVALGVNEFHFV